MAHITHAQPSLLGALRAECDADWSLGAAFCALIGRRGVSISPEGNEAVNPSGFGGGAGTRKEIGAERKVPCVRACVRVSVSSSARVLVRVRETELLGVLEWGETCPRPSPCTL